jgi:hypothetical protein
MRGLAKISLRRKSNRGRAIGLNAQKKRRDELARWRRMMPICAITLSVIAVSFMSNVVKLGEMSQSPTVRIVVILYDRDSRRTDRRFSDTSRNAGTRIMDLSMPLF